MKREEKEISKRGRNLVCAHEKEKESQIASSSKFGSGSAMRIAALVAVGTCAQLYTLVGHDAGLTDVAGLSGRAEGGRDAQLRALTIREGRYGTPKPRKCKLRGPCLDPVGFAYILPGPPIFGKFRQNSDFRTKLWQMLAKI